jgi:GTP 3',8-cyclase
MEKEKIHLFNKDKLRIAITNTCNLSCFYCHNEGQELNCNAKFLPLSYIKDMTNWLLKNNIRVDYINITGGEPLLHPDILEIVKELTKLTNKIRLNTNATLLNKELIDKLKDAGVYSLKIGIDSIYAKQSKPSIYTSAENINNIIDMIKYASLKMGVVLNTVVSKFNYKDIDKMVNFAREAKLPRIKIIRLNDTNSRKLNNNENISEDFKTNQEEGNWYYYFFTKYVTSASKTENHADKGRTDLYFDDGFQIRLCDDICEYGACGNMYTEIDADGNVLICQRHNISLPISFKYEDKIIFETIEKANKKMCNSITKNFEFRDNFNTKKDC